ncbi:hypothetical protein [Lentzea sp. E54]|uniref:hypothetical protein n=1 Tax=Lentzea xerophila TaxID=3435883 RepID=UPI003DA25DD2
MTTTAYGSPRPVTASLKQPEVDRASLNDVLQDQGWGVQAVNWVFEAVTGESLVATIITPITGDWSKIRADGDAWRMVGNAMNDVSYNLTDAVGKVRDHWDGDAARAHERYIALGWKAGLLAEMGVAQLIAKGFDTVASGAEALGKQAARLLDYLVNKLLEAAATVWIPVAGWIKAAEMVWNAYQIYRRVMDIIETVQKLISDVKALFDAVGRVFSAIGKLKDADTLAEAMNATQEVAEAGRDVRNAVNDIHDDFSSIKESATEIADRGQDIGTKVREIHSPPGVDEDTKPAAVSAVAPGGAPVAAPPPLPTGSADTPATHTAAAAGGAVSAPPSPGAGSGGGGGGVPAGGGGHGPVAPPRLDTTHAAGAAPAAAPPSSSHQTPMGGAMPMGAPMAPGAGGDQTRSSSARPGAGGVPAFPSAGTPAGPPKAPSGLPTPPGAGSGLPTPPSHGTPASGNPASGNSASGARPSPGLPTPPSSGNGLPTPPSSGSSLPSVPESPRPTTDHSAPSGADVRAHDPQPGPDLTPAGHDPDPRPADATPSHTDHPPTSHTDNPPTSHTDNPTPSHTENGDAPSSTPPPTGPDLKGHFDASAMAAQGQGYQHQLEQMLPNQADRDRYVELSQKLSTDLSADEAQHVADVRNQIRVDSGDIVTKALNQGALSTYLPDQPHAAGSKQETWQNQMGGSIARGQDVVDVNTPQGLRDGLALDDKGKGWTPIPEGAQTAMQLRYEVTDQNAAAHNVPFGGPKKDVPDFNQFGPRQESEYQSPQEQAHYEASQKQMAAAGGSAKVYDGYDPFTGTGYTMGGMPEWRVDGGTPLPDRAEIWQVNADGTEKLHAVYDRKFGWTKL